MKILKYPIFLFFSLLYFTTFQNAKAYDLTLSLGNICEYVGKIQTDEARSTNFCSFNPYLAGSYDYPLYENFHLSPEVGFSMPKHGRDELINKMSFLFMFNNKYQFTNFYLIGGAGLFITRVAGNGGTQELNNGTTTESFPMPESAVYSRNFILNLGIGTSINNMWSADIHTYIFNALTKEDRAFSILINGTYHFGEFI